MNIVRFSLCILTVFPLFISQTLHSQEVTLTGIVRDQNTHHEIRAVNVFVKDTKLGTATDHAGRFVLAVPGATDDLVILFRHIAYFEKQMTVGELRDVSRVGLQPRVIPLQSVQIEGEGLRKLEIEVKDLPQTVSVIEARNYDIRGYVDAGDLLRIDHSLQVDESLSGTKTVTIRGGNSDEVVVLYNGIKMNNAYNNIFDLSLINLEDVERFEIIKGSNTTLYGPEAFSGVINIVPKTEQDYTIRFQQRFGTYRSGNWGLHLYKRFGRLYGTYSINRGGQERNFSGMPSDQTKLENTSLNHTANLNYDIGTGSLGKAKGTISAMWLYTDLEYDNQRDVESLDNTNGLFSLKYSGALFGLDNFDISASYKDLDEKQKFTPDTQGLTNREIDDRAYIFNAHKRFSATEFDLLFAYQFQDSELDFLDIRRGLNELQVGLEGATLKRKHHGFAAILKYHGDTGSDFFQNMDVDVSVRHDRVDDSQNNVVLRGDDSITGDSPVGAFDSNAWRETMFKFAIQLSGYRDDLSFNSYLNFGKNTKFPTLFQQISSPSMFDSRATTPNLEPEKNRSVEVGVSVGKDTREHASIYGWEASATFFQNHYDNKFREFNTPGIPVTFYDNVQNAQISGFEGTWKVFLFQKMVSVDLGIAKYSINDKALFPFKSDSKRTVSVNVDRAGYAFQLLWFHESEQTGWLRFPNGEFGSAELDAISDIDVHVSKTFEISKVKVFANFSGRNLLDHDEQLVGLAIRDRRFYLTIGAQY